MKKIITLFFLFASIGIGFSQGPASGSLPIDKDVWFLVLTFVILVTGMVYKKAKTA